MKTGDAEERHHGQETSPGDSRVRQTRGRRSYQLANPLERAVDDPLNRPGSPPERIRGRHRGVMVSDDPEMITAPASVKENSRNSAPVSPPVKPSGVRRRPG